MLVNVASDQLSVFMELLSFLLFLYDYWRPKKFWNSSINTFLVFSPVEVMFITYKKRLYRRYKVSTHRNHHLFCFEIPNRPYKSSLEQICVYLFRAV